MEWCSDRRLLDGGIGPKDDPTGSEKGTNRVLRGGSWNDTGANCRSAARWAAAGPASRIHTTGFRAALVPSK